MNQNTTNQITRENAAEILERYARSVSSPWGNTWHLTYQGQSFNSPSKAGLLEQMKNQDEDIAYDDQPGDDPSGRNN